MWTPVVALVSSAPSGRDADLQWCVKECVCVKGPEKMWQNSSLGFDTTLSWQCLPVLHLNLNSPKCSPGIRLSVPAIILYSCGFLMIKISEGKLWLNHHNVCDVIPSVTITTVKEQKNDAGLDRECYCCQTCDVRTWLGPRLGWGTMLRWNQEHQLFKQCGCQIVLRAAEIIVCSHFGPSWRAQGVAWYH